jgi:hypothetical protein
MTSEDGDFDYSALTRAQLEYAVQHIDADRFPKNLALARAALAARVSGASNEPASRLDAETSAAYTHRFEKILGVLVAAYTALAVASDDFIIPDIWRARFIHLHGASATIAALAFLLLAAIPFLNGVTDGDPPALKPRFRIVFRVAMALVSIAILIASIRRVA